MALAEILDIIVDEHQAILDRDLSEPVTGLVAAGALERVARRQSIAELELLMLLGGAEELRWASPDRDIWVAEHTGSWAGMIERHATVFHVVGPHGQRLGTFPDLCSAAAKLAHTDLVPVFSAMTPA